MWPLPAPKMDDVDTAVELWWSDHFVMLTTPVIDLAEIELTQQVWEELPERVQEGLFKLSILPRGTPLEGVGKVDQSGWCRLYYDSPDTMYDKDIYRRLKSKYGRPR